MKSIHLSSPTVKPTFHRVAKAAVLGVALIALAAPAVQAGHLLTDVTTSVSWAGGFVAPTGTFDLMNNNLIFRQATGVSEANAASLMVHGEYTGPMGYWDGTGINSSSAANDVNQQSTIGDIDNSQLGYTSFNTVTGLFGFNPGILNGTNVDILVKTTWYGDADLDGYATLADYSQWAGSFGGSGNWLNGDFDADGQVTLADYTLWASAFSFTGNGATAYTALSGGPGKAGVVPEPGSLGLLALGAMGFLGNRRKRTAANNVNH